MVIEALQSYAQLASGLTKTTREKAMATAKGLLDQAGLGDAAADASDRVAKLAEEILATSKANRQLLTSFVDSEVQKAVAKLGLAKAEDIDELRAEVAALRVATSAMAASAASAPETAAASAEPTPAAKRPAKKAPAKKAPAKKAPAKKTAAKKAPAKKTAAKKSTASSGSDAAS